MVHIIFYINIGYSLPNGRIWMCYRSRNKYAHSNPRGVRCVIFSGQSRSCCSDVTSRRACSAAPSNAKSSLFLSSIFGLDILARFNSCVCRLRFVLRDCPSKTNPRCAGDAPLVTQNLYAPCGDTPPLGGLRDG